MIETVFEKSGNGYSVFMDRVNNEFFVYAKNGYVTISYDFIPVNNDRKARATYNFYVDKYIKRTSL